MYKRIIILSLLIPISSIWGAESVEGNDLNQPNIHCSLPKARSQLSQANIAGIDDVDIMFDGNGKAVYHYKNPPPSYLVMPDNRDNSQDKRITH